MTVNDLIKAFQNADVRVASNFINDLNKIWLKTYQARQFVFDLEGLIDIVCSSCKIERGNNLLDRFIIEEEGDK